MSITNYSELRAAVASWLNRSDLTSQIPDLIALAEQRINFGGEEPYASKPVRVPAMQAQTTGTGSTISFPDKFLEVIRLSASVGGVTNELTYCTPQEYAERTNSQDTPTRYTFLNNTIVLTGTGSADYTLDYYQKFDPLTTTDVNWLLTNAPAVYLYGALVESAPFLYDDPRINSWFAMYKSAANALTRAIPRPAGGSLQVRVVK